MTLTVLAAIVGCGEKPSQRTDPQATKATKPPPAPGVERPFESDEAWLVFAVDNGRRQIGQTHLTIAVPEDPSQPVTYQNASQLRVRREESVIESAIDLKATETQAGELVRYQLTANNVQTTGTVEGNELKLEIRSGKRNTSASIPWSHTQPVGVLGVERSLFTRPMQPGETRQIPVYDPLMQQVEVVTLTAAAVEETPLLDGTASLLRLERAVEIAGQKMTFTMWLDEQGHVQKELDQASGVIAYRTTAERAKQGAKSALDVFALSEIRLDQPIQNPHELRTAKYRLRLESGDLAKAISTGPDQTLTLDSPTSGALTIQVIEPTGALPESKTAFEKPTAHDSRSSTYVDSDDPRIQALAMSVAATEESPWKVGLALEGLVSQTIRQIDYSQAFATASEVLETRQGDCTEHAVLLAALARARGVPARCVLGLVYVPQKQSFLYHMWVEIWSGDRWLALDAVQGRGGIDAAHIKISTTSLAGAEGLASLVPLSQLIGRLKIEHVGP